MNKHTNTSRWHTSTRLSSPHSCPHGQTCCAHSLHPSRTWHAFLSLYSLTLRHLRPSRPDGSLTAKRAIEARGDASDTTAFWRALDAMQQLLAAADRDSCDSAGDTRYTFEYTPLPAHDPACSACAHARIDCMQARRGAQCLACAHAGATCVPARARERDGGTPRRPATGAVSYAGSCAPSGADADDDAGDAYVPPSGRAPRRRASEPRLRPPPAHTPRRRRPRASMPPAPPAVLRPAAAAPPAAALAPVRDADPPLEHALPAPVPEHAPVMPASDAATPLDMHIAAALPVPGTRMPNDEDVISVPDAGTPPVAAAPLDDVPPIPAPAGGPQDALSTLLHDAGAPPDDAFVPSAPEDASAAPASDAVTPPRASISYDEHVAPVHDAAVSSVAAAPLDDAPPTPMPDADAHAPSTPEDAPAAPANDLVTPLDAVAALPEDVPGAFMPNDAPVTPVRDAVTPQDATVPLSEDAPSAGDVTHTAAAAADDDNVDAPLTLPPDDALAPLSPAAVPATPLHDDAPTTATDSLATTDTSDLYDPSNPYDTPDTPAATADLHAAALALHTALAAHGRAPRALRVAVADMAALPAPRRTRPVLLCAARDVFAAVRAAGAPGCASALAGARWEMEGETEGEVDEAEGEAEGRVAWAVWRMERRVGELRGRADCARAGDGSAWRVGRWVGVRVVVWLVRLVFGYLGWRR